MRVLDIFYNFIVNRSNELVVDLMVTDHHRPLTPTRHLKMVSSFFEGPYVTPFWKPHCHKGVVWSENIKLIKGHLTITRYIVERLTRSAYSLSNQYFTICRYELYRPDLIQKLCVWSHNNMKSHAESMWFHELFISIKIGLVVLKIQWDIKSHKSIQNSKMTSLNLRQWQLKPNNHEMFIQLLHIYVVV